jgi:hypothetical protein
MPPGVNWPKLRPFRRRHRVTLTFGRPILPREGEHRTELMERIRMFFAEQGAQTTPGKVRPRPAAAPTAGPAPVIAAEQAPEIAAEPAPAEVATARRAPLSPAA